MDNLDKLRRFYKAKKKEVDAFLKSCTALGQSGDTCELFKSLCCNLLSPQVDWKRAEEAVEYLNSKNLLFKGDVDSIKTGLEDCGYRFTNKAEYLHEARERFFDEESGKYKIGTGTLVLVYGLRGMDPDEARSELVDRIRIRGMGMKTASHFLRGLGLSQNQLAILDRHILDWLVKFKVIDEIPKSLSNKRYLEVGRKMKNWQSREVPDIPLDVLDWLLWSMKDS